MDNEKQNLNENNIEKKDVAEENKKNKSDDITILKDNELCESVVGGSMPDYRPMPLYGVRPRPIPILKYGIERPSKTQEEKGPEGDKKEDEKKPEIKPLNP